MRAESVVACGLLRYDEAELYDTCHRVVSIHCEDVRVAYKLLPCNLTTEYTQEEMFILQLQSNINGCVAVY